MSKETRAEVYKIVEKDWPVHETEIAKKLGLKTDKKNQKHSVARVHYHIRALKDQEITVYGDGTQTRSFCYVDDLIEGLIRMMEGPDDFIGPVNLGNPGEFTILELAEAVIRITKSRSKILPLDMMR